MGNAETDFQLRALETMIANRAIEYELITKINNEVVQQLLTSSGTERVLLTQQLVALEDKLIALGKELNDLNAKKRIYQKSRDEALSSGQDVPPAHESMQPEGAIKDLKNRIDALYKQLNVASDFDERLRLENKIQHWNKEIQRLASNK